MNSIFNEPSDWRTFTHNRSHGKPCEIANFDWKAFVCTKSKMLSSNHIKDSLKVKFVATFVLLENWKERKTFCNWNETLCVCIAAGKMRRRRSRSGHMVATDMLRVEEPSRARKTSLQMYDPSWHEPQAANVCTTSAFTPLTRFEIYDFFLFCFTLCKCRKPFCAAHCTHIPLIHEVLLRFIVIVASLRS